MFHRRRIASAFARAGTALLVSCLFLPSPAGAGQDEQATEGRVVATITTLEGSVQMSGVAVELRESGGKLTIAKTLTDGVGQVTFPDVRPGQYVIIASRPGFIERQSAAFTVRGPDTAYVLLDMPLAFVPPPVEVRANAPSPTDSVQPVSMSDMLSGPVFESAPLQGDDFQSLLPLLPGVVRDADGRLRIKGGQPTQGALQVSSASLIDPSTGDFDVDLPAQSVESVEVLSNPFAAEYRPLLVQHHADPDPARHQRLGYLDWQPDAAPAGADSHPGLRTALLGARADQEGSRLPRAGRPVPLRGDAGAEPAGRAGGQPAELRLVHAGRRRAVHAPCGHRRPDPVPPRARAARR